MEYSFRHTSRAAVLAAALFAAAAAAECRAAELLDESFFRVQVDGKDCGRLMCIVVRMARGAEVMIHTHRQVECTFMVGGKAVGLSAVADCFEREDGKVEHFSYSRTFGADSFGLSARIVGTDLEVNVIAGKTAKSVKTALKGEPLGPWAIERKLREIAHKEGTEFETFQTVPEMGLVAVFKYKSSGKADPPPGTAGQDAVMAGINAESEVLKHPYREIRGKDGMLVSASLECPIRADILRARKEDVAEKPKWRIDFPPMAPKPVANAGKANPAGITRFRISGPGVDALDFSSCGQAVLERDAGRALLKVECGANPGEAFRPVRVEEGLIEFLAESEFADDLGTLEFEAGELLRDEKRIWESARAIGDFICRRSKRGPWDQIILPASRYARTNAIPPWGRAVTTVAWCRAAAIPARIAAGFRIEAGNAEPDLWAEVLAGSWAVVDGGTPGSICIRMMRIPDYGDPAPAIRRFLEVCSGLSVEVVE